MHANAKYSNTYPFTTPVRFHSTRIHSKSHRGIACKTQHRGGPVWRDQNRGVQTNSKIGPPMDLLNDVTAWLKTEESLLLKKNTPETISHFSAPLLFHSADIFTTNPRSLTNPIACLLRLSSPTPILMHAFKHPNIDVYKSLLSYPPHAYKIRFERSESGSFFF